MAKKKVKMVSKAKAVAVCIVSSLLVGAACGAVFTKCYSDFPWTRAQIEAPAEDEKPVETPDEGTEEGGEQVGEPTDPGQVDPEGQDNGAESAESYDAFGDAE